MLMIMLGTEQNAEAPAPRIELTCYKTFLHKSDWPGTELCEVYVEGLQERIGKSFR